MIKKGISLFLSILLLHNMVLPAYAQAWEQNLEHAFKTASSQPQVLAQDIQQALELLTTDHSSQPAEEELSPFAAFQTLYTEQIQDTYAKNKNNILAQQKKQSTATTKQDLAQLDTWFKEQLAPKTIQRAYQQNQKEFNRLFKQEKEKAEQQAVEQARAHLKELARRLQSTLSTLSVTNKLYSQLEDLMIQSYPLFWAVRGLEPQQRQWGAAFLRKRLQQWQPACASLGIGEGIKEYLSGKVLEKKIPICQKAVEAAGALSILGSSSEDKKALQTFLNTGKNGIMSAAVLTAGSVGLLELGGENELVSMLVDELEHMPAAWEMGLTTLDAVSPLWGFQTKVQLYKELAKGVPWVGQERIASFYKTNQKSAGQNILGNAWTDIGFYLGESARQGNQAAQGVLARIANRLFYPSNTDIAIRFPALLGGILQSGYHFPSYVSKGTNGEQFNADGSVTRVDTRARWTTATQAMKKADMDLEGYLLAKLYLMGKSDLDPWTKASVNNALAAAYVKENRPALSYLSISSKPTAEEIKSYHRLSKVDQIAGWADIIAAVLGVLALGVGLVAGVSSGTRGIIQLGRTIRSARAGTLAAKGARGSESIYIRLIRMASSKSYKNPKLRLYWYDHLSNTFGKAIELPKAPVPQTVVIPQNPVTKVLETALGSEAEIPNLTAAANPLPKAAGTLPSDALQNLPSIEKSVRLKDYFTDLYWRYWEKLMDAKDILRGIWNTKKLSFPALFFGTQASSAPYAIAQGSKLLNPPAIVRSISAMPSSQGITTLQAASVSSIVPQAVEGAKTFSSVSTIVRDARPLSSLNSITPIIPVAAYNNEQLLHMGGLFHKTHTVPAFVENYWKQTLAYQKNQFLLARAISQHVTPLVSISLPSTRKAASWVAPLVVAGSMLPQPVFASNSVGNVFSSPAFMLGAGAAGVMGLAASGAFGKNGFIGKPIHKLFNTPFQIAPMVSPRGKQHAVWELNNLVGRPLGYIKCASSEEVERTQQFLDLIQQIDPASVNLLSLQYPSILAQGIAHLSPRLQRNIRQQASALPITKSYEKPVFMNLSSIDTFGQLLMDLEVNPDAFAKALAWQAISFEEWNQVENLFRQLNDLGFQHTDLEANIWFKRLSDGRLQLNILDFEKRAFPKHGTDLQTLQYYKQQLIEHHLLGERNFFDHPQNRPHYLSQADENLTGRAVWEVQNRKHQKMGYLKLTDLGEMGRTKKFHELAQQKIPALDLIEIEYPKILSTGWNYLPADLQRTLIEEGGDKDFVSHNSVGPMIISSVDISGFMPSLVLTNHAMRVQAKKALRGRPIMMVEWEQILAFFRYMNEKGFNHGDLMHNLWLRRTDDGALKMTVMDFEEIYNIDPGYNDVHTLQIWQKSLRDNGLLQQNAVQNLPSWQQSWLDEADF